MPRTVEINQPQMPMQSAPAQHGHGHGHDHGHSHHQPHGMGGYAQQQPQPQYGNQMMPYGQAGMGGGMPSMLMTEVNGQLVPYTPPQAMAGVGQAAPGVAQPPKWSGLFKTALFLAVVGGAYLWWQKKKEGDGEKRYRSRSFAESRYRSSRKMNHLMSEFRDFLKSKSFEEGDDGDDGDDTCVDDDNE